MFSLQILCPLPFGGSLLLYSSLGNVFFPFVDRSIHHLSACPIRHLPKPLVSCDGQGNTIQESSSHKCNQEVWWDALNVGGSHHPFSHVSANPSPKLFLNSRTSSGNVSLTWPYCPSMWPPQHDNGLLDHSYDTWHRYLI